MTIISLLLIIMNILILSNMFFAVSYAHGYVESPPARAQMYRGNFDMVGSAAWEPQSLGRHQNNGWPFTPQSPSDGSLASVDCTRGCPQIDRQSSTLWNKTDIPTGWNTFTWLYTAWHATASWQFFITKQGWNQNAPLARESFDLIPIYEQIYQGDQARRQRTNHEVFIPTDRSGYHVIYAVWTTTPGQNNETFYNVIDVNIINNGSAPPPTTEPPTTEPGNQLNPPANLRVTNQTESTITLAWNASNNSINIEDYEIYRDGMQIAEVSSYGPLTYTDMGLTPGTTYNYTVRAHAISEHSNTATGTTEPINATPPELSPPVNLRVTATSININWDAPTSTQGLLGYRIYRDNVLIGEAPLDVTYFIDSGLVPNIPYMYVITTVDQFGNEAHSQTMTVSTLA